jgi:ubiquinol-cytochrome c reductase iron-sulfur subunit
MTEHSEQSGPPMSALGSQSSGHSTEVARGGAAHDPSAHREEPGVEYSHELAPGLTHTPRRTDIDPKAAKRVERQVLGMFLLSALGTLVFFVGYYAVQLDSPEDIGLSTKLIGGGLGVAMFFIGTAAIHWARKLMSGEEVVQERHPLRSSDEERAAVVRDYERGVDDSSVPRRKALIGGLVAAITPLLLTPIVLLRDLGPLPRRKLRTTVWAEGIQILSDVTKRPLRPADIPVGGYIAGIPATLLDLPHEESAQLNERAKSAVMLMRLRPEEIVSQQGDNWDYDGILCYSRICTHVGCPLGLYEQTTHHMLCPCHQSTFDIAESGKVLFGPAARNLPQLAITVDDDGYLIAKQGFTEPVGPSFWERG